MEISVAANISAHEWPIYQYQPQKSHIGRSLVQNSGNELYSQMNLTLKCVVIDLCTLEEILVSQPEKHIFNKPLNILPRRCSEDFFLLQDLADWSRLKAWWIQINIWTLWLTIWCPECQTAPLQKVHFFQQDLAPCRCSKKTQNFLNQSGINVLGWTGNSPYLNPIKNLWAIIKRKLCKHNCST